MAAAVFSTPGVFFAWLSLAAVSLAVAAGRRMRIPVLGPAVFALGMIWNAWRLRAEAPPWSAAYAALGGGYLLLFLLIQRRRVRG